jgi:hypothetical protein
MIVRITVEDTNKKTGTTTKLVDMSMPVKGLTVDQLAYWAAEGMFALSGEIMDTMDEAEAPVPAKKEPVKYAVILTSVSEEFADSTIQAITQFGLSPEDARQAFLLVSQGYLKSPGEWVKVPVPLKKDVLADEACQIKAAFEALKATVEII